MVALIGRLNLVSGGEISHPWDANAYLISGDEPVLIDCGGSEGYPALARNLRHLGYEPPTLVPGAGLKDARRQLGVYFNPWFEPFYKGSGGHVGR